jgi:hypothetical protein
MTPKEKAEKLVFKFRDIKDAYHIDDMAKERALIAVDLHLEELSKMKLIFSDRELHYKFWQEVRKEIEAL